MGDKRTRVCFLTGGFQRRPTSDSPKLMNQLSCLKQKRVGTYSSRVNKEIREKERTLLALKFMGNFRNPIRAENSRHSPAHALKRKEPDDVTSEEMTLRHDNQSVTFKVGDTKNFSYNAMESVNKINLIDIACEEYSQEFLGFSEVSRIDDAECDPEKDILLLEAILNSEPLSPLPNHANYFPGERKELKICEAKTNETSIDKPSEVELKDLPPHLEYAFLEGDNKLPVINAKDLSECVGE
ncbi:hypothetical protein Tco_0594891 [Tanacetum coccineum]